MKSLCFVAALASPMLCLSVARAAEPASCHSIRLGNIGWTDNEVQNAIFSTLANGLGYDVQAHLYSEEVMYAGMKNGQLDVFLDDWTPSMDMITGPYEKSKQIDVLGPDLTGAKYTLVVPDYLYNQGLQSFSDIQKFGKQLDYKIYGIEPGNDGNEHILTMIKDNKFGLGNFQLVQSSEAGMLSEVSRKYPKKEAVLFLGWEPEPMNVEFNIRYLPGGDAYFGPNEGEATIYINTRPGYPVACPNVGRLLAQFRLSVSDENQMMYKVQVGHQPAMDVAAAWLKAHPSWVETTLQGVTTTNGKPGASAVQAALKSD
ncbi:MAG TPA: glycine betaine ABC transporter substrate-binding protein [Acetobacteraceae bacterium]|jgi:glycine betaine/proline transport system substrate-binding protein|nr:glycine betaine ABC transporter substrate-binding protein [Acetobacteraceae bacterium]